MMTGWLFIIACSACSVLLAHLFKLTEKKGFSTIHVLILNYGVAAVASFLISAARGSLSQSLASYTWSIAVLAFILGLIFIVNLFMYSKSVHHNGIGISVAAMRISLLTPVLLSVLWYDEKLSGVQWVGIGLVFLALFLLLPQEEDKKRTARRWSILPILLFFLTGFGDSALKIFEEESSQGLDPSFFTGSVFITSFFAGVVYSLFKDKKVIKKSEYKMGLKIGLTNMLTPLLLIGALQQMSGAVVYSSVNILTVISGTLLGVMVWSDRLTIRQGAGLFFSLIAILLLI